MQGAYGKALSSRFRRIAMHCHASMGKTGRKPQKTAEFRHF
jgi:hypothetical protein